LIDTINLQVRIIDGVPHYPHNFGDEGWYNFQPYKYLFGAQYLWYWSMKPEDRERFPANDWLNFWNRNDPGYPERALQSYLSRIRERAAAMEQDPTTPETVCPMVPCEHLP